MEPERSSRFTALLRATRVYAVTDDLLAPEQLLQAIDGLLAAGIRLFQYRDKGRPDRERVELGQRLVERIHAQGGLLLVNDRVDIALAVGADGAHLGQDDLPLATGRAMLGPNRLLGASASYLHEIAPAIEAGIDYLGFGAVFTTETKTDAEYAGLDLLMQACRQATVPVVGIGGITVERAAAVIQHGAAGIAVVSALFRAPDPGSAARSMLAAVARMTPRP